MKLLLVAALLAMAACVPPGAGYSGAGGCVTGKRCGATCIAVSKTCHYGKHRRRRR